MNKALLFPAVISPPLFFEWYSPRLFTLHGQNFCFDDVYMFQFLFVKEMHIWLILSERQNT